MKKMTLGNVTISEEYSVPRIEVLVDGEVKGYMSPFRGYFFQVSKTIDGQHSYGRSENSDNLSSFMTITKMRSLMEECLRNTIRTTTFQKEGEIVLDVDWYSNIVYYYYDKTIYFLREIKPQ